MTFAHGARGLAVATSTAIAGDHSILAAVITAAGGVVAVIVAPLVTDRFRRRRRNIDHIAEATAEQSDLSERLMTQLEHANAVIEAKDAEIERLRRRRG